MIENVIRFVIYACSAFVSCKYFNSHWIVGPVFGLAVVGWDSKNFRDLSAIKHLAFLAASSLIYALVFTISSQNWNRGSDLYDSLFGSLPIAVITGSILLPTAHKLLLKIETKKLARTVPLLILSYYVIAFFSLANDTWKWGLQINFLVVSITAWQGIYLYSFFV
jgi:hypothetical protein